MYYRISVINLKCLGVSPVFEFSVSRNIILVCNRSNYISWSYTGRTHTTFNVNVCLSVSLFLDTYFLIPSIILTNILKKM